MKDNLTRFVLGEILWQPWVLIFWNPETTPLEELPPIAHNGKIMWVRSEGYEVTL